MPTTPAEASAAAEQAIIAVHARLVAPLIPADARLWDVHAHLGEDADGSEQSADELLARMAQAGVERTTVFPFAHADIAGFRRANDAVLEAAAASGGRLVPYCRVHPDPASGAEIERALAAGARGVKLHPLRGRFGFDDPVVERAVAAANEHAVPVLLHAGRNVDPYADEIARLLGAYRRAPLVLAHGAMSDLHRLGEVTADFDHLVVDTSLWNPLEVRAVLATVPPERLVFGTDAPYYLPWSVLAKLVLPLRAAGCDDEAVRQALWGRAERIATGEGVGPLSAPIVEDVVACPLPCLRAHQYLLQAVAQVWTKQSDLIGVLPLARRALAAVGHVYAVEAAALIDLAARTWPIDVAAASQREVLTVSWATARLIDYADALVVNTPSV